MPCFLDKEVTAEPAFPRRSCQRSAAAENARHAVNIISIATEMYCT